MVVVGEPTHRRDLLASLHPVTRALRRIEEAAAARDGLTMWQYAVLSVVAERLGPNQRELAAHLQYSPNRLVADLHDLERRGWLTRRPGADRRANLLEITEAGDAVRRRIQAEIHRQEDALLAVLTDDQRVSLVDATRRLADRVRAGPTTTTTAQRSRPTTPPLPG